MEGVAFYGAAAQIIPVLLLALVLELRLVERTDAEPIADGVWFVGCLGTMVVGELTSVGALLDGKPLTNIGNVVILVAILYGVVLIALLPIAPRVTAIRQALPDTVAAVGEVVLMIGVVTVVALATFGVFDPSVLSVIAGAAVLALIIVGRGLATFRRRVE